nr:MAG TPA: hypothetical protein [Caudoviricetes sp.]
MSLIHLAAFLISPRTERTHSNKRGLNVRSCFWHYGSGWWANGGQHVRPCNWH